MNITKFGHACLLIEEGDARLLIDPGSYSDVPTGTKVDAILITHNHQDHLDPAVITRVLGENPEAIAITCAEAAQNITDAGISHSVIEDGGEVSVNGVSVRSTGKTHAIIYGDTPVCQNTGYIIANRLYHPGDSFHVPEERVEVLALPVAGPWMKLAECIDFAKTVVPKVVFPIHDGFIRPDRGQTTRRFPQMMLEPEVIEFKDLNDGETITL